MRRSGPKKISAGEREAKARFTELVLAKRPILTMPERVSGITDPHHVISKSYLADRFRHLEPEELWAIKWSPDNGIAVDRFRHEQITNAFKRLEPLDLREENVEFAIEHDLMDRLNREVPGAVSYFGSLEGGR
jgi:hypothetical protein